MSDLVYPDELVTKLTEEIAYNKGTIPLSELWEVSKKYIDVESNPALKKFVLSCLHSCPDIILYYHGTPCKVYDFDEIMSDVASYKLGITETKLWVTLTGYDQKECKIGNSAFELLLEIAKSREEGITTSDLTKKTRQDPRSVTGRLRKIKHLISDVQKVHKGHLVKQVYLKKFYTGGKSDDKFINSRSQMKPIIDRLKQSKNGIRQTSDLKRELNLDKDKRLSRAFIGALSWLDEKGYLEKVLVVSPTNPAIRIRCVRYVRDYVEESKNNTEYNSSDEDDNDDEDVEGEGRDGDDEDDILEGLDNFNATGVLQDQGLILEKPTDSGRNKFLLNRFYPIQNQTYDLAAKSGIEGVSTPRVIKLVTGRDFRRNYTRFFEYFVNTVGKKPVITNGLQLIRLYDFEGKKKFYRIFTKEYFEKFTNVSTHTTIEPLPALKYQKLDIATLNKKSFSPLSGTLEYSLDEDGRENFFWSRAYGTAPIGRPRKNRAIQQIANKGQLPDTHCTEELKDQQEQKQELRHSQQQQDDNSLLIARDVDTVKVSDEQATQDISSREAGKETQNLGQIPNHAGEGGIQEKEEKEYFSVNKNISVDGFSATSLKSLQRQRAILTALMQTGGIAFLRKHFFSTVSKFLGNDTTVDKKTVGKDVILMAKSQKIMLRVDPGTRKKLIALPGTSEDEIEKYLMEDKNQKITYFNSVIKNTDIYFFNQTARDKFHTGVKSVERIRQYQKKERKTKKQPPEGDLVRKPRMKRKKRALGAEEMPKKKLKAVEKKGLFSDIKKEEKPSLKGKAKAKSGLLQKPGITYHVGEKSGFEALIMAVVISKSITNEIKWDQISRLFPKNRTEYLKKRWTLKRVSIGHSGWKAYVEKWKRILVDAIKEEHISMEAVERLDLPRLIKLWTDYEMSYNNANISLFKDYDLNKKKYILTRPLHSQRSQISMSMSSMVQREIFLFKQTYSYKPDVTVPVRDQKEQLDGYARAVVRSILLEKDEMERTEITALQNVPRDVLDKAIMDVARQRQAVLLGSKLEATTVLREFLELKGNYKPYEEAMEYSNKFLNFLYFKNGVIISRELSDEAAWLLVDLISRRKVRLDVIPIERQRQLFDYKTRKFEIATLSPPLICSLSNLDGKKPIVSPNTSVPVPLGRPYSKLWVSGSGTIRIDIWKYLVCLVTNYILYNPGVQIDKLEQEFGSVVSGVELSDVCRWLLRRKLMYESPYGGFYSSPKWYTALA